MLFEFDPTAYRADLKSEGDHWVVSFAVATGKIWSRETASSKDVVITRDAVREESSEESLTNIEDVIGILETSLRRAGWRAARRGQAVSPPTLEIWDLSPAADYVKPYHLFDRHPESTDSQG